MKPNMFHKLGSDKNYGLTNNLLVTLSAIIHKEAYEIK